MAILKLSALGVASLVIVSTAVAGACGGSSSKDQTSQIQVDREPITALAGAAAADALNMEAHAAAMASLADARPDHAHWASDAELIKANAASLRFLADSAQAIARDPGSHPGNAVQPQRVLGDGLNLQRFGETLIAHANAMQSHLDTMRKQATGDSTLLARIDESGFDVQKMQQDGQAAIDRGKELADTARRIAAATGEKIE
jgi:hypothetical protein